MKKALQIVFATFHVTAVNAAAYDDWDTV